MSIRIGMILGVLPSKKERQGPPLLSLVVLECKGCNLSVDEIVLVLRLDGRPPLYLNGNVADHGRQNA